MIASTITDAQKNEDSGKADSCAISEKNELIKKVKTNIINKVELNEAVDAKHSSDLQQNINCQETDDTAVHIKIENAHQSDEAFDASTSRTKKSCKVKDKKESAVVTDSVTSEGNGNTDYERQIKEIGKNLEHFTYDLNTQGTKKSV